MNTLRPFLPKLLLAILLTTSPALGEPAIHPLRSSEAEKETEPGPGRADPLLPLPKFTSCNPTTHPLLPDKWEAVALMQDFFQNSFTVGKFVYDENAGAFRFSLVNPYGVNADLLVTKNRKLYRLEGGDQPTSCSLLTSSSFYTVPSRDWLDSKAVCVGQAPILKRDQQWWKSPSGDGAIWHWYNSGDRLPFRSMYYADAKPTKPVPIYEYFTFNYFPIFKKVMQTNLPQILALCQKAGSAPMAAEEFSRPSVEPLLKESSYPNLDAERMAQIGKWIPGLTACSSPGALPPPWPTRAQATIFMTAVSFKPNPFPTRVFYDWEKKAQSSTLYYYPQTPENGAQKALLLGNTGYISHLKQNGAVSSCLQALPGPQVPNWKEVDGCECRAQIAPRTVLNPSDVPTKILWCPTDLSQKQVFWTWYSNTGVPVVFMQTNSSPTDGTGLNLADYYQWAAGSVAPPNTFDLPDACKGKPPIKVPQACHNCHLPLNPKKND